MALGSGTFDAAFSVFADKPEAGQLFPIFCVCVGVAAVVELPCLPKITMVEGALLDVERVTADRYDAAPNDNAAHTNGATAHTHSHRRGTVVRAPER